MITVIQGLVFYKAIEPLLFLYLFGGNIALLSAYLTVPILFCLMVLDAVIIKRGLSE